MSTSTGTIASGRLDGPWPRFGTAESTWSAAVDVTSAPEMSWGTPGRVVVVAPHPDDEVLGCGGLIRQLAAAGHSIEVVAVTDGEAAYGGDATARRRLAATRLLERRRAFANLGAGPVPTLRLRLDDARVAEQEDELASALRSLLLRGAKHHRPATWCLATWRLDGHPDHEATGRAAARACEAAGSRLAEYVVWGWHLLGPDGLPTDALRTARLTAADREAKERAIRTHRSQLESPAPGVDPVLEASVIEHFLRDFETVIVR
ncbi:MAG TPA: PIG-L family deacetylase [Acidimicrobiales bacterium]|nr:PIG-L family deacetylase [Acidimicrobiales bacterium]